MTQSLERTPRVERVVAKALHDPFYAGVVRNFGAERLCEAGFFDDGSPIGHDMTLAVEDRLLVTPLGKIRNAIQKQGEMGNSRYAVLVTSGAFCPIHKGHLQMMESARQEAERRGWNVVGGFFTPDHDGYVSVKCGQQTLSAPKRVYLAQVATEESEWLAVDPWAALYVDRAVNFTDIVRRLSRYLQYHFGVAIEVIFVCGADNSGFRRAFVERGHLIVVPRLGAQISCGLSSDPATPDRILIAQGHLPNQIASRTVRQGRWGDLPPKVCREFRRLAERDKLESVRLFVRDEGEWSIIPWKQRVGDTLNQTRKTFSVELTRILTKSFRTSFPHSAVEITSIPLGDQSELIRGRIDKFPIPTISLDSCIQGHYTIASSRQFEVTSGERCEGIFHRPGEAELERQIEEIPSGSYVLMDDDIATGATIRALCALLPSRITIQGVLSAQEVYTKEGLRTVESSSSSSLVDVVDLRDFLVGSREGGLVVRLPNGTIARAPYLLPYVQNSRRMSLPTDEELGFSRAVWKLNREFFDCLPVALVVGDCHEAFRHLALSVGFTTSTTMSDFCQWHVEQLGASLGSTCEWCQPSEP
jgi:nicotinic acid mononucleotide adenylyltransferase